MLYRELAECVEAFPIQCEHRSTGYLKSPRPMKTLPSRIHSRCSLTQMHVLKPVAGVRSTNLCILVTKTIAEQVAEFRAV